MGRWDMEESFTGEDGTKIEFSKETTQEGEYHNREQYHCEQAYKASKTQSLIRKRLMYRKSLGFHGKSRRSSSKSDTNIFDASAKMRTSS